MSIQSGNPLIQFSKQLIEFARGERRGIRNPFVMVPVDPAIEHLVTRRLEQWIDAPDGRLEDWEDARDRDGRSVTATAVRLDAMFPQTTAFQTCTDLGPIGRVDHEAVQSTLDRNLATELVDLIIDEYLDDAGIMNDRISILLLLNLGSLYPFTRASELLDELDRKNVSTTVGMPFPGSVIGGRLSFFNEEARHYYPAHRVNRQISEGFLTDV